MRIPFRLRQMLIRAARRVMERRPPDFVIGRADDVYLRRWWVIPRNPVCNIYLHDICHSDDDRALHDHPWANCTIVLLGMYVEHTIQAGGVHRRVLRRGGDIVLRRAKAAHRLETLPGSEGALTLFLTGPRLRRWGFHHPDGWRAWAPEEARS